MSGTTDSPGDVVVHAEGMVSGADRAYAREKVAHVRRFAPGPVLYARVDLTAHADPARERPCFVKAELDVNGHLVRARVSAGTMPEAIDLLADRLGERLERFSHHLESKHLRHRANGDAWQHGGPMSSRPPYFPRPVDEREVVRQKTFAVNEMSPDEAALDLELLDHDFYLFRNVDTGEDNVITRTGDARYELLEPSVCGESANDTTTIIPSAVRPSKLAIDAAAEILDFTEARFVFFLDAQSGRGRVLYRRYDGHYGLIVPADEPANASTGLGD